MQRKNQIHFYGYKFTSSTNSGPAAGSDFISTADIGSQIIRAATVELEERIHSELLDNPALEEGKEHTEEAEGHEDDYPADENEESGTDYNDDLSLGDYRTEDDIPDYKLQENNRSKGETPEEIPFSDSVSFYETLKEQLDMQDLTPEEKQLGEYLIGSLDDDGLLRKTTEALMDELAIYQGIYTTPEQLEHILSIIQDFDPAGIGARSLQECLLLQIKRKENSPLKQIEYDIINKCCDDFTKKNKDKILQKLGITEEQYNAAVVELTKLNPRPGSSWEKQSVKTCSKLFLILLLRQKKTVLFILASTTGMFLNCA